MSRTPSRDNAFERSVRSLLFARGLRYQVHFSLPGMPRRTCDVAFPKKKIAIFLDGCFWHGCPVHGSQAKTNSDFWSRKFKRNTDRDHETDVHLHSQGWRVLRFWEHEQPYDIVDRIVAEVAARTATDS
ncbi:very short patch repair endonuclease [Mesorhizobium sp. BR1-1-3]|uniref:very short patch repair endonuclease n=1 Tax=Mesorhizobium sp. BR1-1-3 TaxID=2876651 RepID=UPI001CD10EC8|nr:very short patch repair endonuclease [Mesorhizobium sp. BR1-1-3]MBZ9887317.1 very short patch repair endonuclease [Mesorhizobium sp. BR1-1-3]